MGRKNGDNNLKMTLRAPVGAKNAAQFNFQLCICVIMTNHTKPLKKAKEIMRREILLNWEGLNPCHTIHYVTPSWCRICQIFSCCSFRCSAGSQKSKTCTQHSTAEHSSELRIFAVVTSALPPLHLCLCTALGPFGSQYNIESIIVWNYETQEQRKRKERQRRKQKKVQPLIIRRSRSRDRGNRISCNLSI